MNQYLRNKNDERYRRFYIFTANTSGESLTLDWSGLCKYIGTSAHICECKLWDHQLIRCPYISSQCHCTARRNPPQQSHESAHHGTHPRIRSPRPRSHIRATRIPYISKIKSCKLCKNNYMFLSTQITNIEIFAFLALLVFKLLSPEVLFINRKDNRNC